MKGNCNMFIKSDNLTTLKVLCETYYGKVNIIHINPLKEGATDDDLLTERLVKRGVLPLSHIEWYDNLCIILSEKLVVCLARFITEELFATIRTTNPSCTLLYQSFGGDVNLKVNLPLQPSVRVLRWR